MRVLIAVGGLLVATNLAVAADLPAPASIPPAVYVQPVPWTGVYFGANVGWNFGQVSGTGAITGGLLDGLTPTVNGSANGALVGTQIGFNYQINALVVGLEGDIELSGLRRTTTTGVINETVKIQWLGTVRGRAGFAIDRLMLYGTGGLAYVAVSDDITTTAFGPLFSASSGSVGWTAGAGVEAMIDQNWTVKFEYLYIRSNFSFSGPLASATGGSFTSSGTVSDNIVRVGFNFKP